ncbi:hypothetical protein F5887DRAFT_962716 [Amanita rubescens]|nr:hypothetical protein F5887DRAFT_962716 [Amanita rubescens]
MRSASLPRLGKLCFRRLSVCRHIAVERAPRAPLSFGNRTYSSFSARPNNTLAAKIWYRKDGTPRSKWKLALFVFACFAYAASKELSAIAKETKAASLILLQSDVDTSSMDLSTPRGAITHFRDLMCTGLDKHNYRGKAIAWTYDTILDKLDSGRYSPDKVEELHRVAKEMCEVAHKALVHQRLYHYQDEHLNTKVMELQLTMLAGFIAMTGIARGLSKPKQTKGSQG